MTLQEEIGKWHRETFGEWNMDSVRRSVAKVDEEVSEFFGATNAFDEIEEAADVYIATTGLQIRIEQEIYCRFGVDLHEHIRAKLEILKSPDRNQVLRDKERGIE